MRGIVAVFLAACSASLSCSNTSTAPKDAMASKDGTGDVLTIWARSHNEIRDFLRSKHGLTELVDYLRRNPDMPESRFLISDFERYSGTLINETPIVLQNVLSIVNLYDGAERVGLEVILARVGDKTRIDVLLRMMQEAYEQQDYDTLRLIEEHLMTFRFGDRAEYWMVWLPHEKTFEAAAVEFWTARWESVRDRAVYHGGCWYPHGERSLGLGGGDCDECKRVLELKSPAAK